MITKSNGVWCSRSNMKLELDEILDIPCFWCSFWKSKRDYHLTCEPTVCQELTDWILTLVESSDPAQVLDLKTVEKEERKPV